MCHVVPTYFDMIKIGEIQLDNLLMRLEKSIKNKYIAIRSSIFNSNCYDEIDLRI